jgi:tryptophan halogenase
MSLSNFVVIGGGTAGWISALYLRHRLPNADITVVESESLGIIGAGEGTVPPFMQLATELNLPMDRLFKQAGATYKNGIKFTGWDVMEDYDYYHGFIASPRVGLNAIDSNSYLPHTSLLMAYGISEGIEFSDYNFCHKLSEKGKVPVVDLGQDVYVDQANYAMHFDAHGLADYLRDVAVERGVNHIVADVVEAGYEDGRYCCVVLEDGSMVEGDFFIDASGFAKLFVKNQEWVSFAEHLTVDSAIPFFLDIEDIPPYTEAIAMKHGWVWKIPLQHRFGCGYVYDSNFTTLEEAKAEVEEMFPEAYWVRETPIEFNPGYHKTPLFDNVLSVGLAAGFVEPLEATSIWMTTKYLREAFRDFSALESPDYVNNFTAWVKEANEDVRDFLFLHYMTTRTGTPFWTFYRDPENAPATLQERLGRWGWDLPNYNADNQGLFSLESWLSVAKGVGMVNNVIYRTAVEENEVPIDLVRQDYNNLLSVQAAVIDDCIDHNQFIKQTIGEDANV